MNFLIIKMLIEIHLHSRKGKRRDYAVRIVSEWTGKEIKFPKGLSCISMARKRIFLFFSMNDFISPFSLQLIDEVTLGSYDISLRRFFEFSVFQNCSQYDMLKTTIFLDAPSYIIFKTAYNQYIGIGTYENEMFIIFDSEGEKINSFYEFPFKFGANLIGCKHT